MMNSHSLGEFPQPRPLTSKVPAQASSRKQQGHFDVGEEILLQLERHLADGHNPVAQRMVWSNLAEVQRLAGRPEMAERWEAMLAKESEPNSD